MGTPLICAASHARSKGPCLGGRGDFALDQALLYVVQHFFFSWYISVAKQSPGETEGSGLKGHRDLEYNCSSIFQKDKTDPAMTCQS